MQFWANFFKGIAISISQIVPGVSGGTIAMILGIYDKLIHAVNNIVKDFKNQYRILLEVGVGAIIGIFLFSNIVKKLLDNYPIPLGYFFIGVILGGAPLMYKKATEKQRSKRGIIFLILGIIAVMLMSGNYKSNSELITSLTIVNFIWLFIGGFIIAIALILPGISGSFMLLILGLYNTVINSITEFNIPILIPIVLGGLVGTIATAKAIDRLLNKFPNETYMIILGFILGSIVEVFPGFNGIESVVGIILGIIGFVFIYFISRNE